MRSVDNALPAKALFASRIKRASQTSFCFLHLRENTLAEDVKLEQIKELVKLVEKHHLSELTVEEDGVTITIKGVAGVAQPAHVPTVQVSSHEYETESFETEEELLAEPEVDENIVKIESPMVGVFYRSPSPDAPSFIEVGDTVEVGQTVGLIEAMKVFSEIPSEVAGVVADIPAGNTTLVQAGQTLVVIRPSEEA